MISVLYVDDEPHLLEIGKLFLEGNRGFSVDCVISGSEALVRIAARHYDALVSDYQMPQMDGITLLKKVRATDKTLPFILFTGRGREEVVIEALNNGADFYIQKGGEPQSLFVELAHKIRLAVQQRAAEASIRNHERREADIINFLPDATFAIDSMGVVIAWNRAMEKMTGTTSDQILGKGNYEYAIPFYHERRPILINLVLMDDPATIARYPYIKRDGKNLFSEITIPHFNDGRGAALWFTASPLYDTKGTIVGAIESIREITERKQAEEALAESEEKYRLIAENTADNIWIVDLDLNLKYISTSARMMRGFSVEDAMSVPLEQAMTPGSLNNATLRQLEEEMAHKVSGSDDPDRPVSFIAEDHGEDGSTIFIENTISLIRDADHKPIGILGVSRDISRRQRAENDLKETKQHFSSLADNIQDPVIILNFSGTVLYNNRAAGLFFGMEDSNEGEHLNIAPFLDETSLQKAHADLAAIAKDGGPMTSEYRVRTAPGETRQVEAVGVRITYDGHDADLVTLRDITERNSAQAALAEANRKLNLLASITRHDVLNKLTVLSGSLILIKRQMTEPALTALLKKAEDAATAIRHQIEFARTYENLGVCAPQWQDLRQVIARLPKILIPVQADIPAVEIFADPMLVLVFANLLDNTQRHGQDVSSIQVTLDEKPEGLSIFWNDDGVGIPEDEKEKIFDRGVGKNTGLGLFLVREILDITHITIRETGEPGKGVRFEMTVPKGQYRFL
ncbi:MAG: PAS domain S-box protein [Methanoregula sp.]|nr:PAS domain S-box protein [Methanoregula sp.]